jgi:hypothetical protein
MRHRLHRLALAAAVTLAACADGPTALSDQEASLAVSEFARLADSLTAAGADADVASAYRALANTVRGMGQLSPVVITVDGTPTEFVATARELDFERTGACAQPGNLCQLLPPLRSMIAWQRSNPRRVVQLTAAPGGLPLGVLFPGGVPTGVLESATLTYLDGAGGIYVGSSGTELISDPVVSETPCWEGNVPTISPGATCRRADFTVSFAGAVAPPPFPIRDNAAAGTHALSMSTQPVAGARYVLSSGPIYPIGYLPPIVLRGTLLPAFLSVDATAVTVTFTLRVTNPRDAAITMQFPTTQQFDFRVRRLDGTTLWTWSETRDFAQVLTARTLAAHETVTWTATWTPTQKGLLNADGRLTSSSHAAAAATGFLVP